MMGIAFCPVAVCQAMDRKTSVHKVVYLTFDDGPSLIYTPKILTVLQQEHVHATFFILGARAQKFPNIARRIVKDGHEIGNHGYCHDFLKHKDPTWVGKDVRKTDTIIHQITGAYPRYYRPPGGIINSIETRSVRTLGHPVALWTVDSRDWATPNSDIIVRRVLAAVQPGSIILMHDGVSNSRFTVLALPQIIERLHAAGYEFARLPL
jgi:peptidoglycan/xylan/chitin deacetylase (PgdA/CDA1 family)